MAEFEEDNDNSIMDVNEIEEINIENQAKVDLTEPANSFLRYYSYFRGEKVAKCRLCKKLIGRKDGSTTGMERHLRTHTKFFTDYELARKKLKESKQQKRTFDTKLSMNQSSSVKQVKLTDFKSPEKMKNDNPRSKKIDDLLLRFICLNAHPLSLMEQNGSLQDSNLDLPLIKNLKSVIKSGLRSRMEKYENKRFLFF